MSNAKQQTVSIAGAGLTASLLTCYLARRGCRVNLYEYRKDFRTAEILDGRSINLALSTRGLRALASVGLEQRVLQVCTPLFGRIVHDSHGETSFQPYGLEGQHINSVSRTDLHRLLLDEADSNGRVNLHFQEKCIDVDLQNGILKLEDLQTRTRHQTTQGVTIGADGAFSTVRTCLQKTDRFNFQQQYLSHGYKELRMPAGDAGQHSLEANALHIWPRHNFMLIALPNLDGSFTCTLFLPFEGSDSFERLQTEEDIISFFRRHFPNVIPHMPKLVEDFLKNPASSLVTTRCDPYHYHDRVAVIGDAAHSIAPFYGQGVNAAFEDCFVLDSLFEQYGGDWARVLPIFTELRKPNADAIAALALHNYEEMRTMVTDPAFMLRKKIERKLHRMLPEVWEPLYSMVTFSNMPYTEARDRAAIQERLLDMLLPKKGIKLALGLKRKLARLVFRNVVHREEQRR